MPEDTPVLSDSKRALYAAVPPLLAVALLWAVFLLDQVFGLSLDRFGILPRQASGLWGILFAPLLHGSTEHIFNNTLTLSVLGWCLMYFYPRVAIQVVAVSWLLGGALVWGMGRVNFHIGASGVIYGMAAFLFFSGMLRRQRTLMALSLLVVFLYGSLVWGILPIIPHISWESHLFGGIIGTAAAWYYREVKPSHLPDNEIKWEEEEEPLPEGTQVATDPIEVIYHHGPDHASTREGNEGTRLDGGSTDMTSPS